MNDVDIVINNVSNGEVEVKEKSKSKIINVIAIFAVILLLAFGLVSYIAPKNYSDIITDKTTETPYVQSVQCDYILNTNTKKAHKPSCRYVDKIDDENRKDYYGTDKELQDKGYTPCKHCQAW